MFPSYNLLDRGVSCPDQDDEVGAKHIIDKECFQPASREPIPHLPGEPWELIELDDDLREDPMAARLDGEEINAITYEEGSQKDEEDNDVDNLTSM